MKYKVGDKVKVIERLKRTYIINGNNISPNMARRQYEGKIVTIREVFDNKYTIKELYRDEFNTYYWTDEMFEGLATKTKTTKYKAGDVVTVIRNLQEGTGHNVCVTEGMVDYAGKNVKIKEAWIGIRDINMYRIEGSFYVWTDTMFKGLATETTTEKKEIKLEEKDMKFKIKDYKVDKAKETVVVFFEDGDVQKAKCCMGDKYDFETGLEVCIMKHICGGAKNYYKAIKVADEQIASIDKARKEAEKRAEIKAKQRAKRAEKRRLRAERKRAERVAEMK